LLDVRGELRKKGRAGLGDKVFSGVLMVCALMILAIMALIVYELVRHSSMAINKFGFQFFYTRDWDPISGEFGALPFIYGTLVSSAIALAIAVPLGVGVALFLTDICPKQLRTPIAFLVELLAAIPSVIYGLWGIFVLAPLLRQYVEPFLQKHFLWTGVFSGPPYGIGMLAAGVILAIMIVPFISSITREVVLAVPHTQREAVQALGATRWETLRMAVVRNARTGIVGGIILALGRALGETMAVTMVIGNRPDISRSLLAPGYTMASVIANEFTEATDNLYLSALLEIGLALLIVTILVNIAAQIMIWSITRGKAGARA